MLIAGDMIGTGIFISTGVIAETLPSPGGSGSGFSLQFSRDPDQSLLYLIDGTNQRVWVLRRNDLAILDRFGRPGRQ